MSAIFFLVPFAFIFLIASSNVTQANQLRFSWPQPFALLDNLAQAVSARDFVMIIAFINSFVLTVVSVGRLGDLWRDGRLRLAAPSQPAQPVGRHLGAGRFDRAARGRADNLGVTRAGSVQDHRLA